MVALECAAALVQGRSNPARRTGAGVIAGMAAASVLLLLLRYDPRLVPAFAATVVLMTGAVKAAQAAAWLPFAVDADRNHRRRRVAHALPAARRAARLHSALTRSRCESA